MDQTLSSPTQTVRKYLLFGLILSLSLGQLARFSLFSFSFYLHDFLIVIYLLLSLPFLSRPQKLDQQIILIFIIFLLLLNPNHLYALRLTLYFIFFYSFLNTPLPLTSTHLSFLLNLSFLLVIIIGLSQYLFLPDTRYLYYLGWDDHLNRLIFPYYDPPFTATILFFAFYWFWYYRRQRFLALLSLSAFFLTYSRASFLAFLFTLPFLFKTKKQVFLLFLFFIIVLFLLPHRFGEGTNLLRTYSFYSRLHHDILHLQNIHHLFWGNPLIIQNSIFPQHASTPNNSFLFLLETSGFVVFCLFLFLIYFFFTTPAKIFWLFTILTAFFNNTLFYPFIMLYLFLITAYTKLNVD